MNVFANNKLIGAVASVLALLLLTLTFVFTAVDRDTLAETMPATQATPSTQSASIYQAAAVEQEAEEQAVTEDVIWLARVIYSETKRPYEQELVAWVVRNRVETAYRGKSTYKDVVLDPWQFSAFNRNAPKRRHYVSLNENSTAKGFDTALQIAKNVVNAPEGERPFARDTRHFYSEISMVGRRAPAWANGKRPVSVDRNIDPRRFRFFRAIA
jgi:hypothetical protein